MIIKANDKSYEVLRIVKIWYGDQDQAEKISKIKDAIILRDEQNYYICKEIEEVNFTEIKIEN